MARWAGKTAVVVHRSSLLEFICVWVGWCAHTPQQRTTTHDGWESTGIEAVLLRVWKVSYPEPAILIFTALLRFAACLFGVRQFLVLVE
jgi:hypothetical protein